MGKIKNLVGMTFGRLTILEQQGFNKSGNAIWKCICTCGNLKTANSSNILRGATTSCGCYAKERQSSTSLGAGVASFNEVYATYKRNAVKRKLVFALDKNTFRLLTQKPCHYCGDMLSNTQKNNSGDFRYNGIDRLDNNKGYIFDNVVTCCGTCNKAKYTMTTKEFTIWIERIYTWQKSIH